MIKKKNWTLQAASLLAAFVVLAGCDGGNASSTSSKEEGAVYLASTEITAESLLTQAIDEVVIPNHVALQTSLTRLQTAQSAYCADPQQASPASAQAAWSEANEAVQRVNAHPFAVSTFVEQGVALGARLDDEEMIIRKVASYCAADVQVALQAEDSANYSLTGVSTLARGIHSLERMLFETSYEHTCPDSTQATQGWNDQPLAERQAQRCDYATTLIEDMVSANDRILDYWTRLNYGSQLMVEANQADAVQALFESLFYIETVKDEKLCIPRESENCPTDSFVFTSAGLSEQTYPELNASLESLRAIYTGDEGIGFDDVMAESGFQSSNETFLTNMDAASALINAQADSLQAQIEALLDAQANEMEEGAVKAQCANASSAPQVATSEAYYVPCRLFGYLKQAADVLKTDVQSVLDLTVPGTVQGDGD